MITLYGSRPLVADLIDGRLFPFRFGVDELGGELECGQLEG